MARRNSADQFDGRFASRVAYVADREAHSRICAVEALLAQGFVCRDFAHASDLLDAFQTELPDLIVMDVSRRDFDALETRRRLESNRYNGSILPIAEDETDGGERLQQLRGSSALKVLPCVAKPLRLRDFEASLDHFDAPPVGRGLAVDVEEAIRNRWISLWYQPKVDLGSLSVCGAEALVRVSHPHLGLVPPLHFLPESGDPKMRLLSQFVVEQTIHDWMTLVEQRRPLELAVNIPMRLLVEPQFVKFLRNRIPIHPRFSGLIVEVDKADVVSHSDIVSSLAAQLGKLNIRISVGDLTCCPLSFAESDRFPFAEIKLGREFVSGCAKDKLKRALCRTVVEFARRVGALTVAMGVETREEMAVVRDVGFDMAQGFFFGRPMPVQELALLIATRRGGFRNLQHPSASCERAAILNSSASPAGTKSPRGRRFRPNRLRISLLRVAAQAENRTE
jgi:EAL domain-containing protein (putative c-di-GMP-specific phosphodiesterase class I)